MSAFVKLLRVGLEAIAAHLRENPYQTESGLGDEVTIAVVGPDGKEKERKEIK